MEAAENIQTAIEDTDLKPDQTGSPKNTRDNEISNLLYGGSTKSQKKEPDILDEAAMENAYNICHNVQDLLHFRGFAWEGAPSKKKKKGKNLKLTSLENSILTYSH